MECEREKIRFVKINQSEVKGENDKAIELPLLALPAYWSIPLAPALAPPGVGG